ncbi:MAG: TonB-dependent receptor [Acidobacteriota bacterium]|nr:TonB-dependent receptor [Acidobacteriota bacterium]MDQ5837735.1 TonB-dependent receptor [Acidobacteriota bacterium]
MSKLQRLVATLTLLMLALSANVSAQTSKGFVVGNVTDPNGAAVTGATVRITNAATGTARQTVTQGDGGYRLDAVDPGTYKVEVSSTGFKTWTKADVTVAAAETVSVSAQLEVGAASEVVTVTSATPVELQTADGTRAGTLDARQITDLPVVGLNPVNLVFTEPGVVNPGQSGGFVQGTEFSINGVRPRGNNQLLDGLDNNDNDITGQIIQPILRDGYDEVSILGSNYSAEYGRAGGAVVNVISKSGRNNFFGSVYDVISPSKLYSLTPGQKSISGLTKVPHFIENIPGFSFGGPIKKNKLFFFGTYQEDRARQQAVATAEVPTASGFAALRQLFPAGASRNLDQYLAVVGSVLAPDANADRLVPLGGGRPSIPFGQTSFTLPEPNDDKQFLARVDWTPTVRDSLTWRYYGDRSLVQNQQFGGIVSFPGFEIDVPATTDNLLFSYTRNLSVKTTNEFRFGFGRFDLSFGPRDKSLSAGAPVFLFSGGAATAVTPVGLTTGFPQGRLFHNYQFQDTLTHTIGDHTFRVGADVLVQRAQVEVPINSRGTLTFAAGGGFPAFGNFVDAFSGTGAGGAAIQFGPGTLQPNTTTQAYFVNDQWKLRPNLTVNLGLRYENYGPVANSVPFPAFQPSFFDPTQPFPVRVEQRRDNNNFAPRFSFAYAPDSDRGLLGHLLGTGKTVLRGGFAVNYDVLFNNIVNNIVAASPSTFGATNQGSSVGGRGFANFVAGPTFLPTSGAPSKLAAENPIEANLVNPVTFVWNLSLQRELPHRVILDAAYVGSRGEHQFINVEENPGVGGFGTLVRSNPAFGSVLARTNAGDSVYHSLQVRAERGFSNGMLFRLAYTFSKSIDDVNSEVFTTSGGSTRQSDPLGVMGGFRADRSVSTFDVPHRFAATALYDIPALLKSGWGRQVFGGFTLSGTYRIQSGAVETPYVGGFDLNGDGSGFNDRPSISNPAAPPTSVAVANVFAGAFGLGPSPTGYFDPVTGNAVTLANVRYVVDPAIRTNIAGRNTLRGPSFNRLDLSLQKSVRVPGMETGRFDFRVDFFNVLNHPYFAWDHTRADGDVLGQFFNQPRVNDGGQFAGSRGANRYGQIQLRFSF